MIQAIQNYLQTTLFFSYPLRSRWFIYLIASGLIGSVAFCVILFHATPLVTRLVIGTAYVFSFGSSIGMVSEARIFYLNRKEKKNLNFSTGELWLVTLLVFLVGFLLLSTAQVLLMDSLPVDLRYYADPVNGFRPFSLSFFLKMVPIWIIDVFLVTHLILKKVRSANASLPGSLDEGTISIEADGKSYKLNPKNISHISVVQHYAAIYLFNADAIEKIEVRSPLKSLLEQLPQGIFVQTHRSHIVNLGSIDQFISGPGGSKVRLKQTNVTIPVSRRQANLIKQAYKAFEEGKYCRNKPIPSVIDN